MSADSIRVLVVDDSSVVRGIISRALRGVDEIEVVGVADNGQRALDLIAEKPVDVVVLDIEMPVMDGLTALPRILETDRQIRVIIASTLSQPNAKPTIEALQAGAADYLPKPGGSLGGCDQEADDFKTTLCNKVTALGQEARKNRSSSRQSRSRSNLQAPGRPADTAAKTAHSRPQRKAWGRPAAIGIGSSTGGPQTLSKVLQDMVPVHQPVLITQHMPATFTSILAGNLAKQTGSDVVEGKDGDPVEGGRIYVAPGNLHMTVNGDPRAPRLVLKETPPENYCRPSVDPMLKSMVATWGRNTLAVILTGMGHDGLYGCRSVSRAGGPVFVQDEATSTVWGMPGAVAKDGIADLQAADAEIGKEVRKLAMGAQSGARV